MATQIALDATGTKLNFDSNTFVIDESTNNVGIGTASPSGKLHVDGDIVINQGNLIKNTASHETIRLGDSNGIQFSTSGTERLRLATDGNITFYGTTNTRIQANGDVGIGNTSPSQKLHVTISESTTTQNSFKGLHIQNSSTTDNSGSAITFSQSTSHVGWAKIGIVRTTHETADIFFSPMDGGSTSEKVRIKSDGGVIMNSLPTSNPGVSGALWNDGGTVKIS